MDRKTSVKIDDLLTELVDILVTQSRKTESTGLDFKATCMGEDGLPSYKVAMLATVNEPEVKIEINYKWG